MKVSWDKSLSWSVSAENVDTVHYCKSTFAHLLRKQREKKSFSQVMIVNTSMVQSKEELKIEYIWNTSQHFTLLNVSKHGPQLISLYQVSIET